MCRSVTLSAFLFSRRVECTSAGLCSPRSWTSCPGRPFIASLHTLLQILSLTVFEKILLQQALAELEPSAEMTMERNQLNLFAF
jgi:hypothetical protein